MGPRKMSMENMQNISWAGGVYNNIKKLILCEIKLNVITIIIAYKGVIISEKYIAFMCCYWLL